jgi:CMP-N-acetylneuraminic acid synthetase
MITAVIPVKEKSERVINKNFKIFYKDLSLLEYKIEQLQKNKNINRIVISSNSKNAKKIAIKYKIDFVNRPEYYCNNKVSWSEVIEYVISSVGKKKSNEIIMWCHTTSPLFNDYSKGIKLFLKCEKKGFDSLVSVNEFNEFLLDSNANPINYNWGPWHKYSQNLKKNYFTVNGALFIARKTTFLNFKYVIGKNPVMMKTKKKNSIDIDNDIDFKYAKFLLEND